MISQEIAPFLSALVLMLNLLIALSSYEIILRVQVSRRLTRNGTKEMSLRVNVTLRNNIYIELLLEVTNTISEVNFENVI